MDVPSFSSGSLLVYPLPGLSLRWYVEVLTSAAWMRALGNSLFIGALATALAVGLGTLASLGLARRRDAWAAARKRAAAALGVLYDVLPLIALGGGEGIGDEVHVRDVDEARQVG